MMNDDVAARFEQNRARLRAVAYRMLGSESEAEDAVQEAWLKLARVDDERIDQLNAWLTTVVARVCLDMLRSRKSRREDAATVDTATSRQVPDANLALADAIGPALLVVLDLLAPAERVAFVLHDMFDLSFDEIAPIVERSPAAARQLASRARRRVRGGEAHDVDRERKTKLVEAFLRASREGDLAGLVALLSPEVRFRADEVAVRTAEQNPGHAPRIARELDGVDDVAAAFSGRARGARVALVDGEPGAAAAFGGQLRVAFVFTFADDKIAAIDLMMAPDTLATLDVELG
jgi:RNA polymerase sigma-70 factor (ECF subfamily)